MNKESDGIQCNKCGGNDRIIRSMQARSGDELATTIVTCLACHYTINSNHINDLKSDKDVNKIQCNTCGGKEFNTSVVQSRSADEPMTIFVTCLTCYNTFRTS